MEKFSVTIYKGTIAPTTISYFITYLDANSLAYKYVNTYFKNPLITPYHEAYKNMCSNPVPIININYPHQSTSFRIVITRGHNVLTNKDYLWNIIKPTEALILSPVGHINDKLLDYSNKSNLLLPKYFNGI